MFLGPGSMIWLDVIASIMSPCIMSGFTFRKIDPFHDRNLCHITIIITEIYNIALQQDVDKL